MAREGHRRRLEQGLQGNREGPHRRPRKDHHGFHGRRRACRCAARQGAQAFRSISWRMTMAYELRDGQGSLFRNDRREKDTQPHARGEALIGGVLYEVSAWTKEGKKGKFQSL